MAVTSIFSGTIPSPSETASVAIPLASKYVVTLKGSQPIPIQFSLDGTEWFTLSGSALQSVAVSPSTVSAYVITGIPMSFVRLANYTGSSQTVTAKIQDS